MRVAKITVYRMLKENRLPAKKFGKSWKINAAKLRTLMEKED
jgi:excisionase family DNA binding protein